MFIMAPVNSLKSAKAMIEEGAGEIYTGADEELFSFYSFTGRGKFSKGKRILPKLEQLREIVCYAHDHQVKVNFLANIQFLQDVSSDYIIEKAFLKYCENAIDAGVDSIVLGDIGMLNRVHQEFDIELHSSIFFRTINRDQILFFRERGVKRICLSYHITISEIEKMCALNLMDIEVVGYQSCSMFNGTCSFLHDYGESDFDPGLFCKGLYQILDDVPQSLFDVEAICGLCALKRCKDAGVKAIKIVGREMNYIKMQGIIKLFSQVLERDGEGFEELLPKWWKYTCCRHKSCKYIGNKNELYMIGGDYN